MAGLAVSLEPFSVGVAKKISFNIITEIKPIVLENTNIKFSSIFQMLLSGYINIPRKCSQTMAVHAHCSVDYFCLDPKAYHNEHI